MIAFVLAVSLVSVQQAPATPPAAAPQIAAPAVAEPVSVKRVYVANDENTFTLTVSLDDSPPMSADIKTKVVKLIDDKKASVELTTEKFDAGQDGAPLPDKQEFVMDEKGMGDGLPGQSQIVYSMLEVCSIVPGVVLKVGDEYKFDFQFADATVTGSGKLTDLKEVEGKKVAFLSWNGVVAPNGFEINVIAKSEVDSATGKILRCTVSVDSATMKGTIKVEAKKK